MPSNLGFFAYGILAYRVAFSESTGSRRIRRAAPIVSLLAILGLLALPDDHVLRQGEGLGTILWGLAFALLCTWRGVAKPQHGNPVMHYLGERSYSIYLLHPLVIWLTRARLQDLYAAWAGGMGALAAWLACAALLLAVLLVLCEVSYRLVELPGIRVGAWINRSRQAHVTRGTP